MEPHVNEVIEKVPAKAEVVVDAPVTTPATPEGDKPAAPVVVKTYTQAEVDDITRKVKDNARMKRKELQDEARALRRIALERGQPQSQPPQGAQAQPQQPAQPATPTPPKREQYNDDAAYWDAVIDYRADIRVREHTERQSKQTAEHQARYAQEQLERGFAANQERARTKHEDYDDVVYNTSLPSLHPVVIQAIKSLENGPDIAYAIGQDPAEAMRIARLHPILALKELGKIEAKLAAVSAPAGTPAVTPTVAAVAAKKPPLPAPITPVTPKDKQPDSDELSDADDDDTWLRKRNKQVRERGRK